MRLNLPADLLPDEPLARRTTAKVGGVADWLFEARSKDALKEAVLAAKAAGLPWLVLGAGSNVLIADRGIRGVVIANMATRHRLVEEAGYAVLEAESGAMMPKLARLTARAGYGGFEWGTGVPGTVGGSVAGNAGAYGGAVADNLIDCEVLTPAGETIILPAGELRFAYRFSTIKYDPAWVVLSARFRLEPAPAEALAARMAASVHQRKTQQPAFPSSGSVFKNPPGDYAGRLIEAAGLKGLTCGGAQVSETHANFIVNRGGATASDMYTLIEQVRERVRERFGVALELEIRRLGDW